MKKKAQGISINTIIIAAIALIVLVVLVAIFTGRLGGFVGGIEDCASKGGDCVADAKADCTSKGMAVVPGTDCPTTQEEKDANADYCCISVTN